MKLTEYEPIGYINTFVCQKCNWTTLTINLNNGVTSKVIGCNNKDQSVTDGILDTAMGKEEGSPQNPHIAASFDYNPMPCWFREITYSELDVKKGVVEKVPKMRMMVERVWIRPTLKHIEMMTKGDDDKYDAILAVCRDGGLVLSDMASNWDRAEPFARYGRDEKETRNYLDDIYGVK